MTKKLKGYKNESIEAEGDIVEAEELAPELEPDPETIVPSGDEEAPIQTATHDESMKSLYKKARKNRELVQREDAAGAPDVERIKYMTDMAAGGEPQPDAIDTNRPDRYEEQDDDGGEKSHAELLKEEVDRDHDKRERSTGADIPEGDPDSELESEAGEDLQTTPEDAMVEVKVLGRVLEVPQQDVDDAGGIEAYQKNRTANVKLQRAATLEKRALKSIEKVDAAQSGDQQADPPQGGQQPADIDSLHEELMDVVVDGSVEDTKAWLENLTKPKAQEPTTPAPARTETVTPSQQELDQQFEEERSEANQMMLEQFPDIMGSPDAMALAQQRFRALRESPDNLGRTQKEMAREAAMSVRRFIGGFKSNPKRDPAELERQTRVERKRSMPQPSRAEGQAPSGEKPEKRVPSGREHIARLRRRSGNA